jgi:hypothetical protein
MERRTPVYRQIIDAPEAWTHASLGSEAALAWHLDDRHLAAIDALLARTRHKAPQAVTRDEFRHPDLDPFLDDVFREMMDGKGVVLIRGLSREKYDDETCERIYWGFGTHWGIATVQSIKGERLGHVRKEKVNPHNRGYMDNVELVPHTDAYAVVGLMCLQQAVSGGLSQLVSVPAIHNEFLRTRPELLEPLYRGFPTALYEARGTADAITDYNVPIFSCVDGKVSCLYSRRYVREAQDQLGIDLPRDLAEALDYMEALANRDDLRLNFLLQPGEMMVWNNFNMFHSRSSYEDSPTQQRHLLRLWLNVPKGGRSVIPEVFTWGRIYDKLSAERMAAAR